MRTNLRGEGMIPGRALDKALGKLAPILKRLGRSHGPIVLAGGAVRDALLGRAVQDADLVVAAGSVLGAARELARRIGGDLVVLGKRSGEGPGELVRVLAGTRGRMQVDFTALRAATIEGDLRARDFTANALGVAIPWGVRAELIDPTGGYRDIRLRRLRMCGAGGFRDDPVRLWRAHREALELNMAIERITAGRMRREASRARRCTPERLRDELFKLLKGKYTAKVLREARHSGILLATFPELAPMERLRVPGKGTVRILDHTLEALAHLERHISRLCLARSRAAGDFRLHLLQEPVQGRPRHALLRLAALLHDIGKPSTVSTDKDGHVHFFGHDKLGSRMGGNLLRKRLRMAESEVSAVARMIANHLRPGYLAVVRELSDRAVYRFLRDAGEELPELLLLARADREATHHDRAISRSRQEKAIARILAVRRAVMARSGTERLVSGHDIMREFTLRPGPLIGKLLRTVEEAQALGRVRTRAEALRAARKELDRVRAAVIDLPFREDDPD